MKLYKIGFGASEATWLRRFIFIFLQSQHLSHSGKLLLKHVHYHRKAPIMALQTIKTETDASCNPIWIVRHAGWSFCFGILHYHGNVSVAGYNKADLENATGK